jgi:bifunctional enzyme CysN/CysC
MAHARDGLLATDIDAYLDAHENKTLLRFITCGSVDDGKSTLIGRLLHDTNLLFEDHLAQLAKDSAKVGTTGDNLDFALLLDGLAAEREQGITIDVAYRFFTTERRKFIVADTPGHEQYTRNMVTGASTASVAVILVDARKGLLTQTKRHTFLVSLLGIQRLVLAINKMDLIDFDQQVFTRLDAEYRAFVDALALARPVEIVSIPLCATDGDNVMHRTARSPWYEGPTLLQHLELVEAPAQESAWRVPVQWVNRPHEGFRGFAGTVTGGSVAVGDPVRVLPSGTTSTVAQIFTAGDRSTSVAQPGEAVTLVLADERDVSRGDVIGAALSPPGVADQFQADIVWMHEAAMVPGKAYLLKLGPCLATVRLSAPKHRINVNTLEHVAAQSLQLNEIGVCTTTLDRAVPFDPYTDNRETGGFILIDRQTNATIGAGMIRFALRRSQNVHWQTIDVDSAARSALKGHRPAVVWFTGLSGSGKSTIANRLDQLLHSQGVHTMLLDGDNVRHGLNKDLGFTEADRIENIRRIAEVAKLMADAGLVVLVSFISPFRADRELARSLIGSERFCEVFVDAPLEVAEQRDPKGLYRKARLGQLAHFTGIDSPYEAPEQPDITVETTGTSPHDAAQRIEGWLRERSIIGS